MEQKTPAQELVLHFMEPPYGGCNKFQNHPVGILVDWLRRNPYALDDYRHEVREAISDFTYFNNVSSEQGWEPGREEITSIFEFAREKYDCALRRLEKIVESVEIDTNFLKKFHEACANVYVTNK